MNPESRKPSLDPEADRINRILDDLERAVAESPLLQQVETVGPAYMAEPWGVEKLAMSAKEIVSYLNTHAMLGNMEAIRVLADLGNNIAGLLRTLVEPPPDDSPGSETQELCSDPPLGCVVRLGPSLPKVDEVLARESAQISSLPADKLMAAFEARPYHDPGFSVDTTAAIRHAHLMATTGDHIPAQGTAPLADGHLSHLSLHQLVDGMEHLTERERDARHSHITICEIVEAMIESGLCTSARPKARRAAVLVAADLLEWPVAGSAFEDDRARINTLLATLPLGISLPFKFRTPGPGRPRIHSAGSKFRLVFDLAVQLHKNRFVVGPEHLDEMRKVDHCLDEDAAEPADRRNASRRYTLTMIGQETVWDQKNHWKLKAALLPPFPTDASKSRSKDLRLWAEAAIVLGRNMCQGRWEEYTWPRCVEDQSGYDEKSQRNRTKKETFANIVKKSMDQLVRSEKDIEVGRKYMRVYMSENLAGRPGRRSDAPNPGAQPQDPDLAS